MASGSAPLSYSAAVSGSNAPPRPQPPPQQQQQPPNHNHQPASAPSGNRVKRSPSPSHKPNTGADEEAVYVLTLLTDNPHHDRMTQLRAQYFPKKLNKLEAHLTLFHALPGSKLESSIIPVIQDVASKTTSFKVLATKPFRLKKGVAISVAKNQGGVQTQGVHKALQRPWVEEGWLSDQDRGGCHVHYTIMNKVDDEAEVAKSLEQVQQSFKTDAGVAEGLGLWRYDRGFWRRERRFDFAKSGAGDEVADQR